VDNAGSAPTAAARRGRFGGSGALDADEADSPIRRKTVPIMPPPRFHASQMARYIYRSKQLHIFTTSVNI